MTVLLWISLWTAFAAPVGAEVKLTEDQAKLAIIHHFVSHYVRWPGRYSLDATHEIAICSIGEDELTKSLKLLEKASTPTLAVRVRADPAPQEYSGCHVLYFATPVRDLEATLSELRNFPVLTISSAPHFLERGGMVLLDTQTERAGNFEQNYVRYALNTASINRARLFIEPDAIELANRVVPQ